MTNQEPSWWHMAWIASLVVALETMLMHFAMRGGQAQMSAWHLFWIIPLSAVARVVLTVGIIIFDDCLWWASDKSETRGDDNRDNP